MFDFFKLIPLALIFVPLSPLGILFWKMVRFEPEPIDQRKAALEKSLAEAMTQRRSDHLEEDPDGVGIGSYGMMVTSFESIPLIETRPQWLEFYPRKWVGWTGLTALAILMACTVVSLFLPFNPITLSTSSETDAQAPAMD